MIGFLMGTMIAFFVVMGDLGPPMIANILDIESTPKLRIVILVGEYPMSVNPNTWVLQTGLHSLFLNFSCRPCLVRGFSSGTPPKR